MISFCCDIWGIIVIIYTLFFVEQDTNKRSKTLAKFRIDLNLFPQFFSLSLTSNVSSKAVGCFKSYQHQESATYVNLIKYSGSAGHLAFCHQKISCNLPRTRDGPYHFFLGLHLRLCQSHLPRTYTTRIYTNMFFR